MKYTLIAYSLFRSGTPLRIILFVSLSVSTQTFLSMQRRLFNKSVKIFREKYSLQIGRGKYYLQTNLQQTLKKNYLKKTSYEKVFLIPINLFPGMYTAPMDDSSLFYLFFMRLL